MRYMVSTFIVLSMVSVASAQPWPTDNPRGTRQLDALIATATRDKAVDRLRSSDPNQPASFRVNDSAKLKAVFLSEKDALTDETCDAVVLNWRNAAGSEKPFWGQWLRVMAEASRRPRTTGLADLFQGAVLSGDPASQDRVRKSFLSACENFRVANDLAWEAAAENELGLQALSKDQFEEADAAFKKAGDLYTKAFGPKHLLVASTIRNRGNGYSKRQDYMTAARLYREAVDLLDVADPNNAAERVSILQNLSSTYFSQNDMISAIGCIREATEIITKIRGPNDPSLLPFLENLGSIYFSRGEHDKAFESAAQAYEIAKTALGPDNPRVVRYLRTLGDGKRQLGRRKEALEDYRKGLSILEKATPKDDEGIADLRLAIGDNLRELRDANGAIQEYQAAIDLFRHMNSRVSKIKAALTLSKIASVNDSMGRRKEAGELHRQAIADLIQSTDASQPLLLTLYLSYGLHLLQNGEHMRAAEQYQKGYDLAVKLGREIDQATHSERLAYAYRLADDQEKAFVAINEAIRLFRKYQHPGLSNAYSTLASLHFAKGQDEEAVKYDRLAFEFMKSIANPDDPTLNRLGNIVAAQLQQSGKFAEAEAMFQEGANRQLRLLGANDPAYGEALVSLAGCQAAAGRVREADMTLDAALLILRRSASPRLLVSALGDKARLQVRAKQDAAAIQSHREALDVIAASGLVGSEIHARTLQTLGDTALAAGDLRLADESFTKAVATYRDLKASRSTFAMSCIKSLVLVRGRMDDPSTALKWIDEGLAALQKSGPAGQTAYVARDATVDLLNSKSEFLLRVDSRSPASWKKAYDAVTKASEVSDRLRLQKTTGEAKRRIFDNRYESVILRLNLCELLIGAEPGPKWLGEAFRTSEESKARVFLEQLGKNRSAVIGGLPKPLAVREATLLERLAKLELTARQKEVARLEGLELNRIAELQGEIGGAEREMDLLQSQIARDYPVVAALRQPNPCNIAQARACLAPDEIALIYTCGARIGYVILLKPPTDNDPVGIEFIPIGGTTDFGGAVGIMSDPDALKVRDFYEKAGTDLYRMLLSPVEKQIKGKNLVIVPDGSLALLNFEAIRDPGGKFLIETHQIRYAPSMTTLQLNRTWESKRPKPSRPFLGLGDPVFSADDPRLAERPFTKSAAATARRIGEPLPRLASTNREVREAGQTVGAPKEDIWMGFDASEARLKIASDQGRLADFRFLHFATHGQLGAGVDRPPSLILSLTDREKEQASPENEGILTIGEASSLHLNADMVVLSGCHTARGELDPGEGVTGLARAFLIAGTRGVACSLWILDDSEAAEAIRDVYKAIVAGETPARALRQVKLKMIRDGQTPFRWAPLILIGQ